MLVSTVALGLLLASLHSVRENPGGEDISAALELARAEANVPGVVAMAVQDGEVIAWGAAGERAMGKKDPLTIHDPMHLGSCTKSMTSSLVARLIEKEVLTWETTIAEAIPEFATKIDEGYHTVTIEELLKHQGGIAERRRPKVAEFHGKMAEMEGDPVDVRREVLAMVLALPRSPSAPGSFDYSNYGYMTAGAMIETITGKSWEELMVEELFKPMGMESAGIGSPSGEGVPVGHRTIGGGVHIPLKPGPGGALPDCMSPAGLAHSNLLDWSRFVGEHLAGERGEDGFLTAENYQRMHKDPGGSGYAAGWGLGKFAWSWGSGTTIEHNGSDNTWYSFVMGIPEVDLTILVAVNCAGDGAGKVTPLARDLLLTAAGFKE
jgi:CubicO group peptidase (beta-lactamase class C family)